MLLYAAVAIGSVGILLLLEIVSKKLLIRSKLAPEAEFPEEDANIIKDKFDAFDEELGWERQPNENKTRDNTHILINNDRLKDQVKYSTDEYGSRVCPAERRNGSISIATYGDSFGWGGNVDDDETFQAYLSNQLRVHVSNYGVGGYGLGQAILRMKRRFENDPADYIVLAHVSSSYPRAVSLWTHYIEFGRTWNVKPRYTLQEDELYVTPLLVSKKEEVANMDSHSDFLHSNDYNYQNWFREKTLYRPYSLRLAEDLVNLPFTVAGALEYIDNSYGIPSPLNFEKWYFESKEKRLDYTRQVVQQNEELLTMMLNEFEQFAERHGVTPIYLPLSDYKSAMYEYEKGPIDEPLLNNIKSDSSITVVDVRRRLIDAVDDIDELYAGGHHSPKANRMIAEELADEIATNGVE